MTHNFASNQTFEKVELRLSFRQEGEDKVRDSDRKRKWQSEVRDWHGYIFSLDSLLSLSLVSSILNVFPSRFLPSADKWKQRRDRQWQQRSRALDVKPVPVCTGIFALQQCHSLTSNFSSSKWCCGCCLNLQNILRMNRSQGKYFRATLMLLIWHKVPGPGAVSGPYWAGNPAEIHLGNKLSYIS